MKIKVNNELLEIFEDILKRNLTLNEWCEIESCDEYQTDNFCGGFDATEMEFCFSYYSLDNKEYWFQKSLPDIEKLVKNKTKELTISIAE